MLFDESNTNNSVGSNSVASNFHQYTSFLLITYDTFINKIDYMISLESKKRYALLLASLLVLCALLSILLRNERDRAVLSHKKDADNSSSVHFQDQESLDESNPHRNSVSIRNDIKKQSLAFPTDANLPKHLDLGNIQSSQSKRKPLLVVSMRSTIRLEELFLKKVGDSVSVEFTESFRFQGNIATNGKQPGTETQAISIRSEESTLHLERAHPGEYNGFIIHRRSTVAHRIYTTKERILEVEQVWLTNLLCAKLGATPEAVAGLPPNPSAQGMILKSDSNPAAIVPNFDSVPSATAVIYLDFDGQVVTNTSWNSLKSISSINAASSNLSSTEIQEVCRRVSEDFSPFNVTVTTSLARYLNAPETRRIRVIITPSSSWFGMAGGVASLNSFTWTGDTPCWTFEDNLGSAKDVAEATSHEVGHTLGLRHDGKLPAGSDTSPSGEYYYGLDNSTASWGPIMGASYRPQFVQWSRGEYGGATNTEDDLSIITSSANGIGYRLDDKGGTLATAAAMVLQSGSSTMVMDVGTIEKNTDIDVMRFTASSGTINLSINPDDLAPNLFLRADLLDSSGVVLQSRVSSKNNPNVTLTQTVSAGTYYVQVQSIGMTVSAGSSPPYPYDTSGYGSLGRYTVSGSVPAANSAPSLALSSESLSQSASLGVNPSNQTFTVRNAGGQSMSYQISENIPWLSITPMSGTSSGANVVHTISYQTTGLAAGSYSGTITVTAPGVTGSPMTLNVNLVVNSLSVMPPTNVVASDGLFPDKIRVTWDAVSGASSYQVYRATINVASSAQLIGFSNSPGYDDISALPGVQYFYWSKVVKSDLTSDFSNYDSGFVGVTSGNNDAFANRVTLQGRSATVVSNNSLATKEVGEAFHGGNSGGKSLWWTWTAPSNGSLSVDTIGSDFDTTLGVYTGTSVSGLTTRGGDDDSGGNLTSRLVLQVTAGTSYAIAVDGYGGRSGTIRLNLDFVGSVVPPGSAEGITATDGTLSDLVRVSWLAGSGADSYDVYRNTSTVFSSATLLANVSSTNYDDTTTVVGTNYYYWVVSRNTAGTAVATGPDVGFRTQSVSNDSFATRSLLVGSSVSATGDNRQASKESGEPSHGGNSGGKSLWWRWVAPSNGTIIIDTIGSDFDTTLGVYTGSSVSFLTTLASNDDSGGAVTSRAQLQVTAGMSYAIAVDGYNGRSGSIRVNLSFTAAAQPPSVVTSLAASDGTLVDRVFISWLNGAGAESYDVHRNTSTIFASSILLGNTTNLNFDDSTAIAGTTYYYWVVSRNSAGVSIPAGPDTGFRSQPISNDAFANRTHLIGTNAAVTGDNRQASKESGEPSHGSNSGGKSLWWSWTAPSNGTIVVDTIGSDFDTTLGVYTGTAVSTLTMQATNDDSGGTVSSRVQLQVTAGISYAIAVDGYNGRSGTVMLNLTFEPNIESNDAFSNRITLTGGAASVTADNSQASKEVGEPSHAGNSGGKSLWWSWVAPSTGTLIVDTIGSNFDTTLAIYTGTSVSSLASRVSNDDSGGGVTSRVEFQVLAGTVYAIAVDGYNGRSGNIRLNLSFLSLSPEIVVEKSGGVNVNDGGVHDFGNVDTGSFISQTFTIRNAGNANLTGLAVTSNGANATDFTINTNGMSTSVSPGSSTSFTVTFAPGAIGARTATLQIISNDSDENPFDLNISGIGMTTPISPSVLQGVVTNALNGLPLAGVRVSVGDLSTITDEEGNYRIENIPAAALRADFDSDQRSGPAPLSVRFRNLSSAGGYTVEGSLNGYITYQNDLLLTAGAVRNYSFSMSPALNANEMRLVLNWGPNPSDLDSHLWTPQIEGTSTRVYYGNLGSANTSPYAKLDVDKRSGYGPETITISRLFPGNYHYYIHRFSGTGTLTSSEAVVKLYGAGGLLRSIEVPSTGTGDYWHVATIDGATGAIQLINQITNSASLPLQTENNLAQSVLNSAGSDSVVSYLWEFGDGSTSTEENPSHVYNIPGIYQVKLTATQGSVTSTKVRSQYITVIDSSPAPEIVVEKSVGVNLLDGAVHDFGSVNTGSFISQTFTIRNTGTANLTGLTVARSGSHAGDFTMNTSSMATVLAPGASTSFRVTFVPGVLGIRNAMLQIASNDSDENPFDISLTGTATAPPRPEIVVERLGGASVNDGAAFSFGSVNTGQSVRQTFLIRNTGTANLSGILLWRSGINAGDFTFDTTGTLTILPPGATTTFQVIFSPRIAGNRRAGLQIFSNDDDESPFDLSLVGDAVYDPYRLALVDPYFVPRVGNQLTLDLTRLAEPGEKIRISGKLPSGLKFNATTGILSGVISGKSGDYSINVQFLTGRTVVRSIVMPITIRPYPAKLLGSFEGLLESTSGMPLGVVRLTITSPTVWSASIESVGNTRRSARGRFVLDQLTDTLTVVVNLAATAAAREETIFLNLDASNSIMTGTHDRGRVRGFRMAQGADVMVSSSVCNVGLLAPDADGIEIPAGIGGLSGKFGKTGRGALIGMLGDATSATVSIGISETGQGLVWVQPYTNRLSFFAGIIDLPMPWGRALNATKLETGLWWQKIADSKTQSYRAGFGPIQVSSLGAAWSQPANASSLGSTLGWRNNTTASLIIRGAGLSNEGAEAVTDLPSQLLLDSMYNLNSPVSTSTARPPWIGKIAAANGKWTAQLDLPSGISSELQQGKARANGVMLPGLEYDVSGCGLILVPAPGQKNVFRTSAAIIKP